MHISNTELLKQPFYWKKKTNNNLEEELSPAFRTVEVKICIEVPWGMDLSLQLKSQDWSSCSAISTRPRLFPSFYSANPSMWHVVFMAVRWSMQECAAWKLSKAGGSGWEKWRKLVWKKQTNKSLSSNGSLLFQQRNNFTKPSYQTLSMICLGLVSYWKSPHFLGVVIY